MTETAPKLYKAEDLAALPSDERYELIRGGLVEMAPPGGEHGEITGLLSGHVIVYVHEHGLGRVFAAETGFIVSRSPDTVLAPDFAFVRGERLVGPAPKGYVNLVPDLVLETRSPHDTVREVALKVERWIQAGVEVVWDLDPARRSLTVHRAVDEPITLRANETLTEDRLLPGFQFLLSRIFTVRTDPT